MTDPTTANVRITIQVADTGVLSDDLINLSIADAKTITGSTDELALRYYTCYLLADNWDSIAGVKSIEGVSFKDPEPEGFLNAYNKRVKQLSMSAGASGGMSKVMMNKNYTYDERTNNVRPRNGSDPYY